MAAYTLANPENRVRTYIYTIVRDRWHGDRFAILRIYSDGGYLRLGSFRSRDAARRFVRSLPPGDRP
jgi:hypothetical protein